MPIYEYRCEDCDESFEKLVRTMGEVQVKCPQCGSERTKKSVSAFAARVSGASSSFTTAASDCSTGGT